MKVSVLLAVYNGEKTIEGTITSILAQTYSDLEILVVDDGSTDKSAEIVRGFTDERVKYFKQKNSGAPASPRNHGMREATGEMFALCDQDDLWYPEKLAKQLAAYRESPKKDKIGIIYCQADIIDADGQRIGKSEVVHFGYVGAEAAFPLLLHGCHIRGCSVLFPKKVVKEVGSFNEELSGNDEYDLFLRITKKYGTLGLPEILCAWRRTDQSFSIDVSRVYTENEKIFARLESEYKGDNNIRAEHGRNISRVVVAAVLEGNKKLAKEFAEKTIDFPVSKKAKLLSFLVRKCYFIANMYLTFAKRMGKVSL